MKKKTYASSFPTHLPAKRNCWPGQPRAFSLARVFASAAFGFVRRGGGWRFLALSPRESFPVVRASSSPHPPCFAIPGSSPSWPESSCV